MEITYLEISKLIDYINNPRVNDHAVDRTAAAIREFGFLVPVLIKSDYTVIDGHLRLKAARKLDIDVVPCIIVDDLTETQIKALRISINKISDLADWDDELLSLELEGLEAEGYDMDLIGFEDGEIESLIDDHDKGDQESSAKEVDVDGFELTHKCPRCDFEFDD